MTIRDWAKPNAREKDGKPIQEEMPKTLGLHLHPWRPKELGGPKDEEQKTTEGVQKTA